MEQLAASVHSICPDDKQRNRYRHFAAALPDYRLTNHSEAMWRKPTHRDSFTLAEAFSFTVPASGISSELDKANAEKLKPNRPKMTNGLFFDRMNERTLRVICIKHVKDKQDKQTSARRTEKRRLEMKRNQTTGDISKVNSFSLKTKESKRQKITSDRWRSFVDI